MFLSLIALYNFVIINNNLIALHNLVKLNKPNSYSFIEKNNQK